MCKTRASTLIDEDNHVTYFAADWLREVCHRFPSVRHPLIELILALVTLFDLCRANRKHPLALNGKLPLNFSALEVLLKLLPTLEVCLKILGLLLPPQECQRLRVVILPRPNPSTNWMPRWCPERVPTLLKTPQLLHEFRLARPARDSALQRVLHSERWSNWNAVIEGRSRASTRRDSKKSEHQLTQATNNSTNVSFRFPKGQRK